MTDVLPDESGDVVVDVAPDIGFPERGLGPCRTFQVAEQVVCIDTLRPGHAASQQPVLLREIVPARISGLRKGVQNRETGRLGDLLLRGLGDGSELGSERSRNEAGNIDPLEFASRLVEAEKSRAQVLGARVAGLGGFVGHGSRLSVDARWVDTRWSRRPPLVPRLPTSL